MKINNNFKTELIQALKECNQYYEDVFRLEYRTIYVEL